MPLFPGFIPEFSQFIDPNSGTQPSIGNFGTLITANASADTYGSYTTVITSGQMTHDCHGLLLMFNDAAVAGTNQTFLFTVGVDYGSGMTDQIPDVLCGAPGVNYTPLNSIGGYFYFPLYVPAGAAVGIKMQSATAGSNTVSCAAYALCNPRHPEAAPTASVWKSFGVDTGNTTGTAITPSNTASEGAWVDVGTLDDDYWWWQVSLANDDTIMAGANLYHLDIGFGDASSPPDRIFAYSIPFFVNVQEGFTWPLFIIGAAARGQSGDHIYVRAQGTSGTADNALVVAVVGGK